MQITSIYSQEELVNRIAVVALFAAFFFLLATPTDLGWDYWTTFPISVLFVVGAVSSFSSIGFAKPWLKKIAFGFLFGVFIVPIELGLARAIQWAVL
jgi:hypothetical protein